MPLNRASDKTIMTAFKWVDFCIKKDKPMSNPITVIYVILKNLVEGFNPRLEHLYKLETLVTNILERGLITPLVVWKKAKDTFEVLQGTRRFRALSIIAKEHPAKFAELFPNGIPCNVHDDITGIEAVEIRLDHGTMVTLSDPMELQLSANMLFEIGKAEAYLANNLCGIMDVTNPPDAKTRKEIVEFEKDIEILISTKASDDKIQHVKNKLYKAKAEHRRGLVQGLKATWRCPDIVMDTKMYHATGVKTGDQYLPEKLTQANVKKLWAEFKLDKEERPETSNKVEGGECFNELWNKLCEIDKKADNDKKDGKKNPKAMSAKDMKAELTDSKYQSEFARLITEHHTGKSVDMVRVKNLDRLMFDIELVKASEDEYDKAMVTDIRGRAKEMRDTNKDAGKKAAKSGTSVKKDKATNKK